VDGTLRGPSVRGAWSCHETEDVVRDGRMPCGGDLGRDRCVRQTPDTFSLTRSLFFISSVCGQGDYNGLPSGFGFPVRMCMCMCVCVVCLRLCACACVCCKHLVAPAHACTRAHRPAVPRQSRAFVDCRAIISRSL